MPSIGRRIAQARIEAGYPRAEDLAQKIGRSVPSIRKYETDAVIPPTAILQRIAAATGRSVEWFLQDEILPPVLRPGGEENLSDLLARGRRAIDDLAAVAAARSADTTPPAPPQPVTGWVTLPVVAIIAAGAWEDAVATTQEHQVLAADALPEGVPLNECVIVKVNGESMAGAGILPGAKVIVWQNAPVSSGNVVLARWGNGWTLKRYVLTTDGPQLMPDSPAFPPVPVGDGVEIIGRVVQAIIDY